MQLQRALFWVQMYVMAQYACGVVSGQDLIALTTENLRPNSFMLRTPASARKIDEACAAAEAEGKRPGWPRDLMQLDGDWRLLYSSALSRVPISALETPAILQPFVGALNAGPLSMLPLSMRPDALLTDAFESSPFLPRNVMQRIDVANRRIVNSVLLAPSSSSSITLELDHAFSVEGEGGPEGGRRQMAAGSIVNLRLERIRRSLSGLPSALADAIPRDGELQLPDLLSTLASGSFDTTFITPQVRVSRGVLAGPLGVSELRVFVREGGSSTKTWQEEEDELAVAASGDSWVDRWQEGGEDLDSPD